MMMMYVSSGEIAIDEKVLTYEEVVRYSQEPNRKRPIVLLGAKDGICEKMQNKLLEMDANRFGLPVSVTTRTPRPTTLEWLNMDGRDFHFVTRKHFLVDVDAHRLAMYGEFD